MPDPNDPNKDQNAQAQSAAAAPPAQSAAANTALIDPQRVEQLIASNQQLIQKVGELETKKTAKTQQGGQTWEAVTERDLQYIITHPLEYPDHATAALEELRKRDRASTKAEISSEIGSSQVMEQHKEAFDPSTPIGAEVAKILARERNQKDILTDVIELAKYRIEGSSGEEKGRKKTVDALRAATAHTPGAEGAVITAPPSFIDMPKDEFEKHLEKVKMKGFK